MGFQCRGDARDCLPDLACDQLVWPMDQPCFSDDGQSGNWFVDGYERADEPVFLSGGAALEASLFFDSQFGSSFGIDFSDRLFQ
jgi:hypothetical protein